MSAESSIEPSASARPPRRRLRWIGLAALLLVVCAGVLTALGLSRLNGIVRNAVTTHGPRITGAEVALREVSIRPFAGSGRITGLAVRNPEGYARDENALAVEAAELALRPGSLLTDRIEVGRIRVSGVEVLCATGPGGSNWSRILANVQAFLGGEAPAPGPPAEDSAPAPAVEAKDCVLRDLHVRFRNEADEDRGPSLSVGEATIALGEETATLTAREVVLGNPDIFSDHPAARVGRAVVAIDIPSLTTDTVIIDRIRVEKAEALYETSVRGSNFTHILEYVTAFAETMASGEPGASQHVLIRDLHIVDPQARLSPGFSKGAVQAPAPVGDIRIRDFRSDSVAGAAKQLFRQIVPAFEGGAKNILAGIGAVGAGAAAGVVEGGKTVGEGVVKGGKAVVEGIGKLNPFRRREPEEEDDDEETDAGAK